MQQTAFLILLLRAEEEMCCVTVSGMLLKVTARFKGK
jgi:hypothetical protein